MNTPCSSMKQIIRQQVLPPNDRQVSLYQRLGSIWSSLFANPDHLPARSAPIRGAMGGWRWDVLSWCLGRRERGGIAVGWLTALVGSTCSSSTAALHPTCTSELLGTCFGTEASDATSAAPSHSPDSPRQRRPRGNSCRPRSTRTPVPLRLF